MAKAALVVVSALLLAFLSGGCGGGDGDGDEAPTATVVSTVDSSPSPPSDTVPGFPTLEPDVTLVDYESPTGLFAIKYPQGWTVSPWGTGGSGAVFARRGGTAVPAARVTVSCTRIPPDTTYEELVGQDTALLARFAHLAPGGPVDVEVGGVLGKRLRYESVGGGVVLVEHDILYAIAGDCGWRLHLQTWGQGSLGQYSALFEEMIASFRPE